jgi:hypothetical protein
VLAYSEPYNPAQNKQLLPVMFVRSYKMRECILTTGSLHLNLFKPGDKLQSPLVIIKFLWKWNIVIQKKAFYPVFASSKIAHKFEDIFAKLRDQVVE